MSDHESNHTPSQPTKQLSQPEVVAAVKRIINEKFTERELLDLKSYINGLLQVTQR